MKRRSLIFLLLPLLLAGCQSYKKVPYLQNDLSQIASANTSTRSMALYDARIMPKHYERAGEPVRRKTLCFEPDR
uniref:hypothetical protein n=1 Tax=Bacteroides eggerthii TaxID=28111 RepID=UPI003FEF6D9C